MRDPYLVVGTGRSGTSFVARVLHEKLKIFMGNSWAQPPNEHNPKGYYEDAEFSNLNKMFLDQDMPYREWVGKVEKLIEERRKLNKPWGFKDPLLSWVLGLYFPFFDDPKLIRCVRKRELVVDSLQRCYGMSKQEAEKKWFIRELMLDRLLKDKNPLIFRFGDRRMTEKEVVASVTRLFIKPVNLYVAILNRGWIRQELLQVVEWLKDTPGVNVTLESLHLTRGEPICCNRASIQVRMLAKKPKQDFLLMLDNDVVPQQNPGDLVWANKDIVIVPAPVRQSGRGINLVAYTQHPLYPEGFAPIDFAQLPQDAELIECDAVGTGCILIKRRVLEKLKDEQAFAVIMKKKTGELDYGTDFAFSIRAKKAGFKIFSTIWRWADHVKDVGLLDITGYDRSMYRDPTPGKYKMPWGGENGYSIIQQDWIFMKDIIRRNKVKSVLEFGTGLSSLLLSDVVDKVVSYEDEDYWLKGMRKKIKEVADSGHENVKKIDLRKWNGQTMPDPLEKFPLVFVDAPRGRATGGLGRRDSIRIAEQVADRIIVHDAGRKDELALQMEYLRKNFFMAAMSGYHQARCNYWIRKSILLEKKSA